MKRRNPMYHRMSASVVKCVQVSAHGCKWSALGRLGTCSGSVCVLGVIVLIKFYQVGFGLCSMWGRLGIGFEWVWGRFGVGLRSVRDWFGFSWVDLGSIWAIILYNPSTV